MLRNILLTCAEDPPNTPVTPGSVWKCLSNKVAEFKKRGPSHRRLVNTLGWLALATSLANVIDRFFNLIMAIINTFMTIFA